MYKWVGSQIDIEIEWIQVGNISNWESWKKSQILY